MSIPGANVLNMALSLIARQPFQYVAYTGRTLQDNGIYLNTYATPRMATGSVQPVPKSLYEAYGLDFQKNYVNFYVPQGVLDVGRNVSNDQMIFNGQTYDCLSDTPWKQIDGWTAVLAAQVTNASNAAC